MTLWTQMGCQGDELKIGVHWFDHNGIDRMTMVQIKIEEQDKPRTLAIGVKTMLNPTRKALWDDVEGEQVYRYES